MSEIYEIHTEDNKNYEFHPEPKGFIVRLMFDVFNDKGDFLGVESWYLGEDELLPEAYEARMYPTKERASTEFCSCYKVVIKRFYSCTKAIRRQWDGFVHIEQVYTKTICTEKYDLI